LSARAGVCQAHVLGVCSASVCSCQHPVCSCAGPHTLYGGRQQRAGQALHFHHHCALRVAVWCAKVRLCCSHAVPARSCACSRQGWLAVPSTFPCTLQGTLVARTPHLSWVLHMPRCSVATAHQSRYLLVHACTAVTAGNSTGPGRMACCLAHTLQGGPVLLLANINTGTLLAAVRVLQVKWGMHLGSLCPGGSSGSPLDVPGVVWVVCCLGSLLFWTMDAFHMHMFWAMGAPRCTSPAVISLEGGTRSEQTLLLQLPSPSACPSPAPVCSCSELDEARSCVRSGQAVCCYQCPDFDVHQGSPLQTPGRDLLCVVHCRVCCTHLLTTRGSLVLICSEGLQVA
jgi:hypothetical protein